MSDRRAHLYFYGNVKNLNKNKLKAIIYFKRFHIINHAILSKDIHIYKIF